MTNGTTSDTTVVQTIARILKEKKTIAICLPLKATQDAVASALALCFALENEGKKAGVAATDRTDPAYNLVGQDEVQTGLVGDGDVLVVSIPYKDGGVEDVSYSVQNDRLNISISPEAGRGKIEPSSVQYSYIGGKPDLIVTLYAPTLESLGALYEDNKQQFEGVDIINIDRHFTNNEYGTINYVDKKSPSMAQMINEILRVMKVEIDHDIATNLYDALVSATNNFSSYTVNAHSFRMAAFLLDHGADKRPIPVVQPGGQSGGQSQPQSQLNGVGSAPMQPGTSMNTAMPVFEQEGYDFEGTAEPIEGYVPAPAPVPVAPQTVQPQQVSAQPVQVRVAPPAPADVSLPVQEAPVQAAPEVPQPVQLKPQIFKGSSGLNKG